MSGIEKLIVCATAVAVVVSLVGPPGIWRNARAAADWLIVILVLIWLVHGLALLC